MVKVNLFYFGKRKKRRRWSLLSVRACVYLDHNWLSLRFRCYFCRGGCICLFIFLQNGSGNSIVSKNPNKDAEMQLKWKGNARLNSGALEIVRPAISGFTKAEGITYVLLVAMVPSTCLTSPNDVNSTKKGRAEILLEEQRQQQVQNKIHACVTPTPNCAQHAVALQP